MLFLKCSIIQIGLDSLVAAVLCFLEFKPSVEDDRLLVVSSSFLLSQLLIQIKNLKQVFSRVLCVAGQL